MDDDDDDDYDLSRIKSQECDGSDQSRLGSGVIGLEDMLGWIKSQECDGSDQSRLGSGVIGLEDMLGVFVVVYGGMALGFLVLIAEFYHACSHDVTDTSPDKPVTLGQAAARRLGRMVSSLSLRPTGSESTNASSNFTDCEEGFQLQFLPNTLEVPTNQTAY
ncbi:hypothetical protein Bbelb_405460 [Branchiostoma belcheri]|nr:hypothetical protein Bbelb_405460 [Branchiostoma belcheri]